MLLNEKVMCGLGRGLERTGKLNVEGVALAKANLQRFVALAWPDNAPLPPVCPAPAIAAFKERQQAVIDQFNLTPSDKILALCPGAEYGKAKRWS